jgi:phospholipase/carboxylesterase
MTNDRPNAPATPMNIQASSLVETRFIPRQYEPNYAYPLLVLFHAKGGDEDQLVRSMPALSWRNYVGLGLRGPESVVKRERLVGYHWGRDFESPDRAALRQRPKPPEAEVVRRSLFGGELDEYDRLEDGIYGAIRRTRSLLHVHSERIFLVGCGEGAAVAYRLGLSHPERFAGVVAINGWLPSGFRALARMKACRDLPILVVHGAWNLRHPLARARRDVAMLRSGGLKVAFQSYPSTHRLNSQMLGDVDTWLMNHCTSHRGF